MNTCNSNMGPGQGPGICFDRPKSAKEECIERKMYNQALKADGGCCAVKVTMNKTNANNVMGHRSYLDVIKNACAFIRPAPAPPHDNVYNLCDSEVLSVTNNCGEITLSKSNMPNEDQFDDIKQMQKQQKSQRKMEKKRGKARFKDCKKKAKVIYKKYKAKEKQRRKEEKQYYKRCVKMEKKKVKAAKERAKQIKKCTKDKMKQNKRKNKQKLKRLKDRLRRRCEDLKFKSPNEPQSDSCDSMEFEDPTTTANITQCGRDPCWNLEPPCPCPCPQHQGCIGINQQRQNQCSACVGY